MCSSDLTLLQRLFDQFGPLYSKRIDLELTPQRHAEASNRLQDVGDHLGDFSIVRRDDTDGLKCYGEDGSWVLFRLSGTEPIVRIYAESEKQSKVKRLLNLAKSYMEED